MDPSLALKLRKAIAAIEIIGGAMGALLFLRYAVRVTHANPDVWLAALLPTAAFGFCVVAGVLLWLDKTPGRVLTLIALALQVPSIRTATFGYSFNVGLGLRILVGRHGLSWFAFWGSQLHVTLAEAAPGATIGVNVVALVFGVLVWMRRPAGCAERVERAPA